VLENDESGGTLQQLAIVKAEALAEATVRRQTREMTRAQAPPRLRVRGG